MLFLNTIKRLFGWGRKKEEEEKLPSHDWLCFPTSIHSLQSMLKKTLNDDVSKAHLRYQYKMMVHQDIHYPLAMSKNDWKKTFTDIHLNIIRSRKNLRELATNGYEQVLKDLTSVLYSKIISHINKGYSDKDYESNAYDIADSIITYTIEIDRTRPL